MPALAAAAVVLLLALAGRGAAAEAPVELSTKPHRVYAASDGAYPCWRFFLLTRNQTDGPLALQHLRLQFNRAGAAVTREYEGAALAAMVQGPAEAAPGKPLVCSVVDEGDGGALPEAIVATATFRRPDGTTLEGRLEVVIEPRATTYLSFPLRGRWSVIQGRETTHGGGLQFAYDLVREADRELYGAAEGTVQRLEDYTTYGASVYAPVEGEVLAARDDRGDCVPSPGRASFTGQLPADQSELVGNYLVLRAGEDCYVLLAHLRPGSLQVKPGERVRVGQPLACVGNSGNTSGPHLHLEVLDGVPDLGLLVSSRFAQSGLPLGFTGAACERGRQPLPAGPVVPRRDDVLCR